MKKSRQSACVPDRPRYIAVHIHNYIHRKRVGKGKEVGSSELSSATCINKSAFAAIWSSVFAILWVACTLVPFPGGL